jgi:hypothetical protein
MMIKKLIACSSHDDDSLKLASAVKMFVAAGGVINTSESDGKTTSVKAPVTRTPAAGERSDSAKAKVDLLKTLVAKGAGVSALQYSLRMNRKDIKRLATENGLTIRFSQPVRGGRSPRLREVSTVDDVAAGHAMHYSSLGYTAAEIAQLMGLSILEVWQIGKAYRIEFKQPPAK